MKEAQGTVQSIRVVPDVVFPPDFLKQLKQHGKTAKACPPLLLDDRQDCFINHGPGS
jgi:hypothetical protein